MLWRNLLFGNILELSSPFRRTGGKNYKPVSRIQYHLPLPKRWRVLAIIYLSRFNPGSICLPCTMSRINPVLGRATLKTVLYVAFQHARFTRE